MNDHYFSAQPSSDSATREVSVTIHGEDYLVTTAAGIFSPQGVDKGTAVLLRKAPLPDLAPGSTIVDLGCGWGPLTLALAANYPDCRVIGVDVNERALELAKVNAERAGFTNVSVLAEPDATDTTIGGIDLLWSNPPIRIGKPALHELLMSWLNRLNDDGAAHLVVQRNLGADSLATWLTEQGFPTAKLGSQKGFRVLETRRA
ncbi:class I SAM-dependent methyltransferase [Trueperella bialowiezensis]|uniref:class I SAM-dependent methyltransferase n=1 Tax=Trueperella bialowiezensis TaxID=312285 RepID=UPI000F81FBBF|nr:methyltransferase [Trueperella bialowiezensis]